MSNTDLLQTLEGIGPAKAKLFQKIGASTIEEMVHVYPRRYERYPQAVSAGKIDVISIMMGNPQAIFGTVSGRFLFGNNNTIKLWLNDPSGEGKMQITWFANKYITRMLHPGQTYVFYGKISFFNGNYYMTQPRHFTAEEYRSMQNTLEPVYPLTAKLKNQTVINVMHQCLNLYTESEDDVVLPEISSQYHLCSHKKALGFIHFPKTDQELSEGLHRLIFEELFKFMLKVRFGSTNKEKNCFPMRMPQELEMIYKALPYDLTTSQKLAVSDIWKDFKGAYASNRLVQGDVGSGKTMVAIMAMVLAAGNGYQSALMAPTEVLAKQHYTEICELFDQTNLTVRFCPVFLSGSQTAKEKETVYEKIASGEAKVIVGTHAVIQEKVHYKNLALAITDEQHRFGVDQRNALRRKSCYTPHVIVMSATPIPQTLAHAIYGDMDISEMRERPAQRLPIKNCIINRSDHKKVYGFIKKQLEEGRQAYIICPMVEKNEASAMCDVETELGNIKEALPDYTAEMLHGQMSAEEKQAVMDRFSANKTQILVSTTVVEVGVNVPNATVIVIENADSFGMLQLHQLRGRVGRGKYQSYCIFINAGEEKSEKLEVLNKSNDGFRIAEEDYRLRGAGDLFGERQSGSMGFVLADVIRDREILQEAGAAAEEILAWDPMLLHPSHVLLHSVIEESNERPG